MIDLRSDTVTRPTEGMRRAMAEAEVGDDVYGEDPTVARLQERVAGLLGFEAAIFTPTGSMANVLALAALTGHGTGGAVRVACPHPARGARRPRRANRLTSRTWSNARGQVDLDAIRGMHAPDMGPFFVRTTAISVENTHNFAGGTVLPIEDLRRLRAYADEVGCAVHIDGARIWNAHVATGTPLDAYGAIADTMAVCLSKGLGAPIGSLMLGSAEQVADARVLRKRLGGGMRQVGVLAAAGLYALDHHLERMAEDHEHARLLAEACGSDPALTETNIVVVDVPDAPAVVAAARDQGVLVGAVGPTKVRMLTHLDVDRADVEQAAKVLAEILA